MGYSMWAISKHLATAQFYMEINAQFQLGVDEIQHRLFLQKPSKQQLNLNKSQLWELKQPHLHDEASSISPHSDNGKYPPLVPLLP